MKKLLWIAVPLMAICRNEILTLLCLSIFAVAGILALLRAMAEHNI